MKTLILSLLLLPVLVFADCETRFESVNLCAKLAWTQGPVFNKPSAFELTFLDEASNSGTPQDPQKEINIYSWMKMDNGHHHGGPGFVVNRSGNVWSTEKVRFFSGMSGTWFIRVELRQDNQIIEMIEIPVVL